MEVDDIFGYDKLVAAEKANLQAGMNYREGKDYAIVLMSLRENAPYADALDPVTGMLTYEGHDEPQRRGGLNPKEVDQPLTTPRGSWTENGKFFRAAMDFKSGLREKPELIKVYEKISRGIWSYKGFFELIDANIISDGKRKVFKFSLRPVEKKSFGRIVELPHNRLIPTPVKVEVWRRDRGQCVQCGSTKNLHFDHDIPYSKGGSSLTAANVRLLCAKHNLEKSDKILSIAPWIFAGAAALNEISVNGRL
jgi:HNH endonuclease